MSMPQYVLVSYNCIVRNYGSPPFIRPSILQCKGEKVSFCAFKGKKISEYRTLQKICMLILISLHVIQQRYFWNQYPKPIYQFAFQWIFIRSCRILLFLIVFWIFKLIKYWKVWVLVFNDTFNNISVIYRG